MFCRASSQVLHLIGDAHRLQTCSLFRTSVQLFQLLLHPCLTAIGHRLTQIHGSACFNMQNNMLSWLFSHPNHVKQDAVSRRQQLRSKGTSWDHHHAAGDGKLNMSNCYFCGSQNDCALCQLSSTPSWSAGSHATLPRGQRSCLRVRKGQGALVARVVIPALAEFHELEPMCWYFQPALTAFK